MVDEGSPSSRAPASAAEDIDAPPDATAMVDGAGVISRWSAGARFLLGWSEPEALGRHASLLLAEGTAPEMFRGLTGLRRWNGSLALRHREGHRVTVPLVAHRGAPGTGEGGWLLVTALTGREPRAGDEDLARWGFSQSPCATAIYDADLRLRRINARMEGVMGLSEDEVRGLLVTQIGGREEHLVVERALRGVLRGGRPRDLDITMRTGGESRVHAWRMAMAPLRDPNGRVLGASLTAHDTTEEQAARERLVVVNEASVRIGTQLDVTRTAEELTEVCVPRLADFITVDLLDPLDGQHPEARHLTLLRAAHRSIHDGSPEAVVHLGALEVYPERSPRIRALSEGRTIRCGDEEEVYRCWSGESVARAAIFRESGAHATLAVPLRARGEVLGVAVLVRHRRPEPFAEDDVLVAEEIAARAAVCIDNARRYTREHEVALTLQRSLLPRALPRSTAVLTASRYQPAMPHAGVGGAWFDVIPLSGARVALVVGDVVGHGVRASATMGQLRTAVRTLADLDLPPDELLTHLDDLVVRLSLDADDTEKADEVGATCLYAVYDPISRRCALARAGHPPPVLRLPDGTAKALDMPLGPPLGLGGLPYEPVERELPENALLALGTDGLLEGRGRDLDTGLRTLCDVLRRPDAEPGRSLDLLCDTVLGALLPKGEARDDVALLFARTSALDPSRVATWDVDPVPPSVAEMRKRVNERLTAWGFDEDTALTCELLSSEMVTNAIRHAAPPIQLRLILDKALICEVFDASSTAPHLRRARSLDETGRGLMLVASLAQRWGSRYTKSGKTIWVEQPLPSS
ncbi:SpoIIE family protein phosphatase [Streptomyces radicis]|uniref:protein-serine/threonine phosphatase n=1 Tax=Streptomyces radicis TaxID=1750517 RepID=A0A3A9WCZ6_9ACTN|nr:SpoIIE family protein phosphatase [Streptomyces radicis]RKN10958.1 PAS domain S-box protein [Streptomyces radicis]RKN25221.1 PAS domain S-box protein [Streptomyces radicis]